MGEVTLGDLTFDLSEARTMRRGDWLGWMRVVSVRLTYSG